MNWGVSLCTVIVEADMGFWSPGAFRHLVLAGLQQLLNQGYL